MDIIIPIALSKMTIVITVNILT